MSEKGETYNGWTNYETWGCHLWLTNDESTYNHARELVKGKDVYHASLAIKEYVDENAPDMGASMYSDLLNAAISSINFREVAEAFLDE
ncbi:MAG: hypothetical protein M0R06_02520 [Sphaerochaeta sp.]|jgi:hypothetical protein|nr:hypothetical protein [Sphaerochaeta sp.]